MMPKKLQKHRMNTLKKTYTVQTRWLPPLILDFGLTSSQKNNYRIGGKTLLQIFPNKKKGLTQKEVYNDLCAIRELRNLIAHHEPICFDKSKNLSTQYVVKHYDLIKTYFNYMGYDADKLLKIVEKPDSVIKEINKL